MIEGVPILDFAPETLLALVFLFVLTDRLVWHKRLDMIQKQLDAERTANAELLKQNNMLLDSAIPTVNAVLTALHRAAAEEGP